MRLVQFLSFPGTQEELSELLRTRRYCFVIGEDGYVEGHGYRFAICIEGIKGAFLNGDPDMCSMDPDVASAAWQRGAIAPWFMGRDLEIARSICSLANDNIGLTPEVVAAIIASTLG